MAGDIRISDGRWWMVAGWAFRSVLRAALPYVSDSTPSLKRLLDERITGWNYLDLESDCTRDEARVLLNALREGYKQMESAGPSGFGDPSYFPSYMEGFAKLIRLIDEELEGNHPGDCGGPVANTRE
jgi:hypothetical protein